MHARDTWSIHRVDAEKFEFCDQIVSKLDTMEKTTPTSKILDKKIGSKVVPHDLAAAAAAGGAAAAQHSSPLTI